MESLADICSEVMQLFNLINNVKDPGRLHSKEKPIKWPKTRFAAEADRFELWAVNLGVFVSGHGSLDYRIRDADSIKNALQMLTRSLIEALKEVLKYLDGEIPLSSEEDASDVESGPESDTDILLESVRDPVDRLFKLSVWLRNPATRLASSKVKHFQQIDEDTNVNLLDVFVAFDYDYVSSLFLQYAKHVALQEKSIIPPSKKRQGQYDESEEDDSGDHQWEPIRTVLLQHKSNTANSTESYLVHRIAKANVSRRQQFAYWRKHRDKLHQHAQTKIQQVSASNPVQDTIHSCAGIRLDRLAPTAEAQPLSVTTASRLNLPDITTRDDVSTISVSEYAASAWQPSKDFVDFPPPPSVQFSEKFFECPYCFTLCSTALLTDKAWKAHLIHDLRPYICTYEECRTPDQLYDNRQDWIHHENSAHRRIFRCLEHENQFFTTLASYRQHTSEKHANDPIFNESILNQASESTAIETDRCCPVCSLAIETVESMQSHIALHLERFALFSMPRWVVEDGDATQSVGSADANLNSEGTRGEDLGVELRFTDGDSKSSSDETEENRGQSGEVEGDMIGKKNIDTDGRNSSLGSMSESQVGYEDAEVMHRRDLERLENTLGLEHPDTLKSMANLALTYQNQGRWKEAEELEVDVMEKRKKVLGEEHPDTLKSMGNLVLIYQNQGRWKEAEELEVDVMEKRKKVLGEEHPDTLKSMGNLASTYWNQGRWKEAEELQVDVIKMRKRVIGDKSPDTLTSMANLALTYLKQGRWKEAEELQVDVMEIRKKMLGEEHPDTLTSMADLAITWEDNGRTKEALNLMQNCMVLRQRVLDTDHPDIISSVANLAKWENTTYSS